MGKKKKTLPPRRLRMKREGRLSSAKVWLADYQGSNVLRKYKNWYGLDWGVAVTDLRILGIKLDEKYVEEVLRSESARIQARHRRKDQLKAEKLGASGNLFGDSDDEFVFIEGYTEDGLPYGITWENWGDA